MGLSPGEMHQIVRGNSPTYEDNYFELFTDGSGHDATGDSTGSAWTLRCVAVKPDDPNAPTCWRGSCGTTHGTTQRGEFMALLAGLHQISLLYGLMDIKDLQRFAGQPITHASQFPVGKRLPVVWTSDRESLVLQVARDKEGKPFYTRRGDMDLWAQLEFYESWIRLTPLHVRRNTQIDMEWADGVAGHVRDFFVIVRRNAFQEDKPALIAPAEEPRTTAMYCIGEEPGAFWYGPVNDINLVARELGRSDQSTIYKLTPKTCRPVFTWNSTEAVWKRIAK